jgi:Tfp pilus assembly protein PilV
VPIVLRRRSRARRAGLGTRAGLSILEVMVSITLFGAATVAIAGLSFVVAKRGDGNDLFTKRTAVLQQQMNRLQALPYDSLVSKAGTVEMESPFPHTRRITISTDGTRTRVTVQIIPTQAPASTESITFDRAIPTTSPLCTGC